MGGQRDREAGSDIKRRRVVAMDWVTYHLIYHPGASRHPSCSRRGAGISNQTTFPWEPLLTSY